MLDFIDIKRDIEPLVASVEAFGSAAARADRTRLLARICSQLEKLGAADEKLLVGLERASEGGVGTAEAEQAASAIRADESAAAKMLLPRVLRLQRYLTDTALDDDPEAHRLLRKAVNIAVGCVASYPDLREQPIRFDAERQAAFGDVLHARPVEGEIDYDELSREHIERYPKIRAALAK